MSSQEYIKLAQSLHPRLLRFFARFPPTPAALTPRPQTATVATTLNTSPPDPTASSSSMETTTPSSPPTPTYLNPFEKHKHPVTGKWHDPVFSLRRQAELVKLARNNGVEDLLPFTVKGTEVRIRKRTELGLRVKGTGVGQKVKGKGWERTMKAKLERRTQAMLKMPSLVQKWKELGHGRGWKRWPKPGGL